MDKKIRLYCTNCGGKYRRENQKFCAYCGDRCIDDFEFLNNESGDHIEKVEVFHKREQTPRSPSPSPPPPPPLDDITHDLTRTNTMQTDNASRGNVMDEINADVDYIDNDSMKNRHLHLKKETLENDCGYDCCLDGGKDLRDSLERTSSMKKAIVHRHEIDHRTDSATENDVEQVAYGDIVYGRVKRIERYGIFISLDSIERNEKVVQAVATHVALCHISNLKDTFIVDITKVVRIGERVKAKVLQIDTEACKMNVGMKESLFDDQNFEEEKFDRKKIDLDEKADDTNRNLLDNIDSINEGDKYEDSKRLENALNDFNPNIPAGTTQDLIASTAQPVATPLPQRVNAKAAEIFVG